MAELGPSRSCVSLWILDDRIRPRKGCEEANPTLNVSVGKKRKEKQTAQEVAGKYAKSQGFLHRYAHTHTQHANILRTATLIIHYH